MEDLKIPWRDDFFTSREKIRNNSARNLGWFKGRFGEIRDHLWAAERGTEGQWDALSRRDKTWNNGARTIVSHKTWCLTKHIKGCVFSSTMCAPSFPHLVFSLSLWWWMPCSSLSHTARLQTGGCSPPCDSQLLLALAQRVPSDLNVFSCCSPCRGPSCLAATAGSGPWNCYHGSSPPD